MNNDDNDISPRPNSDHSIEARIVAWVMGEAADFEVAELKRMLAENPALASFKERIENTHRLLENAARPDQKALRLSPERRKRLMATLGIKEDLTDDAESRLQTFQEEGKAAASTLASDVKMPAAAKPVLNNGHKKSSVLSYPMAQQKRIWSARGTRVLAIACSLMLTFLVLRVTVFAPRPTMLKELATESSARETAVKTLARETRAVGSMDARAAVSMAAQKASGSSEKKREVTATQIQAKKDISVGRTIPAPLQAEDEVEFSAKTKPADTDPNSSAPSDFLNAPNEPVVLDRFEVEASEDTGYAASNTLAGTRVSLPQFIPDIPKKETSAGRDDSDWKDHSYLGNISEFSGRATPTAAPAGTINAYGPAAQSQPTTDVPARTSALPATPNLPATAKPSEDETIVLSPFSIEKNPAGTANATNTLAGTRVRTDLKDTASAVNVVTSQFLKDIGAANSGPKLEYGPSGGSVEAPVSQDDSKAGKGESAVFNPETSAQTQPVSTFSLHVSDVSFRLAVAAAQRGESIDPSAVRAEEFYNAFDYGDPAPAISDKVYCHIEQSAHPTLQQRNLARIALRVPSTGRSATQPLRLTVLLDTSGSMQRRDRAELVQSAMSALVSLLGPNDRVTLIGFARTPRLLAENISGDRAKTLLDTIAKVPASGGTNFDAALSLAAEIAGRQKSGEAQNRIVLLTDGAANLGNADPKALSKRIESLRQEGIAFDACGVGTRGVDDAELETLARHGDGRYILLSGADSGAEFAKQLAGAFRPAAKNVKVQVRFNSARVAHYRLLGFLQHRLKEEDFRNDRVNAAELAADEAANALYEFQPLPNGDGAVGEIFVRFQDAATGQMVERSWTIPYDAHVARFDHAAPSLQLAGTSAMIALYLQGEPVKLDDLVSPINHVRSHFGKASNVQNLVTLFEQLRRETKQR